MNEYLHWIHVNRSTECRVLFLLNIDIKHQGPWNTRSISFSFITLSHTRVTKKMTSSINRVTYRRSSSRIQWCTEWWRWLVRHSGRICIHPLQCCYCCHRQSGRSSNCLDSPIAWCFSLTHRNFHKIFRENSLFLKYSFQGWDTILSRPHYTFDSSSNTSGIMKRNPVSGNICTIIQKI
jgi:hypothetical protein